MGVMPFLATCHACKLLYRLMFFVSIWVANKVLSLNRSFVDRGGTQCVCLLWCDCRQCLRLWCTRRDHRWVIADRLASRPPNDDLFCISAGISISFSSSSSSSNVGGLIRGLGEMLTLGFARFTPTTPAFGECASFLANVNVAIGYRPSVCLSSVCL